MFTLYQVQCGANCYLEKKNTKMNDLEGVCIFTFIGCQLSFFGSSEWGSSCGRIGKTGFSQSCSTPSGGNTEEVFYFWKTNQTAGDSFRLNFMIMLHCFSVLCFCSDSPICVFVSVKAGMKTHTWLSCAYLCHPTATHMCLCICASMVKNSLTIVFSLAYPGLGCVHLNPFYFWNSVHDL